ncbi:MAG: hypothetical protein NT141_03210 [candidate division WWE3 bacterium]|nr:hypothetical protein [candidate division WWE3 bacterium]
MMLPKSSPKKLPLLSSKSKFRVNLKLFLVVIVVIVALVAACLIIKWRLDRRVNPVSPQIIQIVPPNTAAISEISLYLIQKNLKPENITFKDTYVNFEINGTLIYLPMSDLDNQLGVFWQIWDKIRLTNKKLTKLDLRFHDPVVSY